MHAPRTASLNLKVIRIVIAWMVIIIIKRDYLRMLTNTKEFIDPSYMLSAASSLLGIDKEAGVQEVQKDDTNACDNRIRIMRSFRVLD